MRSYYRSCNNFPCLQNKEKNRANLESLSITLCLIYLCPELPLTACDVPCLSAPRKPFCCSCPIIWFIEFMFVPLTKPYPLPIELFERLCTDLELGLRWLFLYLHAQWSSLFILCFRNRVSKAPPCLSNLHRHYWSAHTSVLLIFHISIYLAVSLITWSKMESLLFPKLLKKTSLTFSVIKL